VTSCGKTTDTRKSHSDDMELKGRKVSEILRPSDGGQKWHSDVTG
jgi:hypothetical protein